MALSCAVEVMTLICHPCWADQMADTDRQCLSRSRLSQFAPEDGESGLENFPGRGGGGAGATDPSEHKARGTWTSGSSAPAGKAGPLCILEVHSGHWTVD